MTETASSTTVHDHINRVLDLADERGVVPIVEAGDPVLRTVTAEFDGQVDDDTLVRLIAVMRTTMLDAPGVGLAAPQIGIPLRLAVIEDPAGLPAEAAQARERVPTPFTALINSRYEAVGDETASFYEGCLSVPGYQAVVQRPRRIALTSYDFEGNRFDREVSGWSARIVAHETDHLDGILYLDRAQMRSLATTEQVARWWSQPTAAAAAQALGFDLPATPIL